MLNCSMALFVFLFYYILPITLVIYYFYFIARGHKSSLQWVILILSLPVAYICFTETYNEIIKPKIEYHMAPQIIIELSPSFAGQQFSISAEWPPEGATIPALQTVRVGEDGQQLDRFLPHDQALNHSHKYQILVDGKPAGFTVSEGQSSPEGIRITFQSNLTED